MKVRYEFVNGEISEIEVDESLGELLVECDRQAYNNDHKETRRHVSLDGMDYEGALFATADDPAWEALRALELDRLREALAALSPKQRELVLKVYFNEESIAAIARAEGVDESSVRERLRWIHKKLKKFLE